jgi:membrane dipeptidase
MRIAARFAVKRHFQFGLMACVTLLTLPAQAQPPEAVARAALSRAPIVDGHNDAPEQIRARFANDFSKFDFRDTSNTATRDKPKMHTDIKRLRAGRVGGQFWSVWVDPELPEDEGLRQVLEQIDVVQTLAAKYPDALVIARTADDVERAFKAKRIASLIGMEGGAPIGLSLAVLRQLARAGVGYMTLTHFKTTRWADSATETPQHSGLTPFGISVVKEMNRLGMLVDLSHVSEATMNDALDASAAPVIFSHSGAQAINRHPRNVPDAILSRLKVNGGVVMVDFVPDYVSEAVRLWETKRAAEAARQKALLIGDPDAVKTAMLDWIADNPRPLATLAQAADHIDHIRKIAGIDHIGIGGDFDGIESVIPGLGDVSTYPALFTELARRGYAQADLEKIASRNILRVMRAAEAAARLNPSP